MRADTLGERLQRARVVAGLSRAKVAKELDVSRAELSRIERGRRRVSTLELSRMARLYRKPTSRCLVEPAGIPVVRYFPSAHRVDERDLMVIQEVGDWFDYYAWLERAAFGEQRHELPTYPLPSGDAVEQGESLAREERSRLGLGDDGSIPSMVALLEEQGAKVMVQDFRPRSRVLGCYLLSESLGPCVIVNRRRPPARRRLDAAHEYAHLLVEQDDVTGQVCDPSREHARDELRANAFAAAFLLPAGGIAAALEELGAGTGQVTPEQAVALSYDFGVSYHAIVARLADLGWIGEKGRRRLERRARVARRHAPAGESGVPGDTESEPARFRSVAVEAWHADQISTPKLADLLDLPSAAVRLLLNRPLLDPERSSSAPSSEPDWL